MLEEESMVDGLSQPSVRLVPEDRKKRMLQQLNNHLMLEKRSALGIKGGLIKANIGRDSANNASMGRETHIRKGSISVMAKMQ